MNKKYQETLDYLYTQLPMFQRVGKTAFKKDLTNIKKLCQALGNPEKSFPTIHIAGTNGKGSVSNMLAAIFQERGYKTGLYTSPHYKDFRERVRINGKMISEAQVIDFVGDNQSTFEKIKPSFFEITVAMAFKIFEEEAIEIGIIETGLGGRLDSTNIINPALSIITNIGYDHQQFLGETLPEIAFEKAGIIKPGIPVVIGETHPETVETFRRIAEERNALIYFADSEFEAKLLDSSLLVNEFQIYRKDTEGNDSSSLEKIPKIKLDLTGSYQAKNLVTVVKAMEVLAQQFPNKVSDISANNYKALEKVKSITGYQGRWQILGSQPTIICDSAHNEQGLNIVLKDLQEQTYEKLHIVLGVVNDKSIDKILAMFPRNAIYYFAKANIPRGLDAEILKEKAAKFNLIGNTHNSVQNALTAAKNNANKKDLIYIGGSTFVVAEVL